MLLEIKHCIRKAAPFSKYIIQMFSVFSIIQQFWKSHILRDTVW